MIGPNRSLDSTRILRQLRLAAVLTWVVFATSSEPIARADLVQNGLALDLEANQGVTTNASGQVTSWADLSGNGHNATQTSSGSAPTLVANAVNGGPALFFNGSSDFLNVAGQVITSQQYTVLALVTDVSTSTSFREVFSNWSGSNTTSSVFLGDTSQGPVRARFTDAMGGAIDPNHYQAGVGTISNPSTPFVLTGVSSSTDGMIYQNTTQIADNGSAIATRNLATPYVIGMQGSEGAEYWNGYISDIVVYNRALSAAEIAQDVAYLSNPAVVPEPSSLALVAVGCLGSLLAWRIQRKRKRSKIGTSRGQG